MQLACNSVMLLAYKLAGTHCSTDLLGSVYTCLTIHMSSFIACVVVTQDLQLLLSQKEALKQTVQDAVAKTAGEKQKAAVQAESADKVSLINSGLKRLSVTPRGA